MTTFFVRSDGSDLLDGQSDATAWATVSKVAGAGLVAGDIVLFRRGDFWPEQLLLNYSGAYGNQLTYGNYFGATGIGARPILSAADKILGPWTLDQAVAGGDRWYATFVAPVCNYTFVETGSGVRPTDNQGTLAGTTAIGQHFWESGTSRVYVVFGSGVNPNVGHQVYGSRRNNSIQANAARNFITLQGLWLRFGHNTAGGVYAIQSTTGPNEGWIIDDVLQEWNSGSGLKVSGGTLAAGTRQVITRSTFRFNREHGAQPEFMSYSLCQDNVFHGNGRQGLGAVWKFGVIRRNQFTYNGNKLALWPTPVGVQGFDAGAYIVGSEATLEPGGWNLCSENIAHHNVKAGLQTDAMGDNNLWTKNQSYLNDLYGIEFEGGTVSGSYGNRAIGNTFWGNVKVGIRITNGHMEFEARNNLEFGNGTDASQDGFNIEYVIQYTGPWPIFSGTAGVDATCTRDRIRSPVSAVALNVSPFTVLTQQASIAAVQANAGSWFLDSTNPLNRVMYVRKPDNSVVASTGVRVTPTKAIVSDYNMYEGTTGIHCSYIKAAGSTNYSNTGWLATFFANEGLEQHGIEGDPLYASAANGDFTLGANSPARNAAVPVPGVNDGEVDMGAIQFSRIQRVPRSAVGVAMMMP